MKEDTASIEFGATATTATALPTSSAFATATKPSGASRQPRRISKAQFLRDYADREDGFKYEFNRGIIEKTTGMNQLQANIYFILLEHFLKTAAKKSGGGLIAEVDMGTSDEQLRRPDIAFFTAEQRDLMKMGINQVAPFVAEIISPSDNANRINQKMEEYFAAGVQVVWHIFPELQQVYVYTSPEAVVICRGQTLCSGAPALPDLQIAAADLFA